MGQQLYSAKPSQLGHLLGLSTTAKTKAGSETPIKVSETSTIDLLLLLLGFFLCPPLSWRLARPMLFFPYVVCA